MKITATALTVRYGQRLAVDRVDLVAKPGQVLGLIGANGSGKSSLLKAIAGVVPSQGQVLFEDRTARPNRIGYMPQDISGRAALTVFEVVLLGRMRRLSLRVSPEDTHAVTGLLADIGIWHLAGQYLGELSGGQRQLVFFAQALAGDPAILLLDEPISALDIRHQLEVLQLVQDMTRTRNLTTICVLHDLNATLRYADEVAVMRAGRLVASGPAQATLDTDIMANAFEIEARICSDQDGMPYIMPVKPLCL